MNDAHSASPDASARVLVVYRFQPNSADGGSAYERMVLESLSTSRGVEAHAIVLGANRFASYARVPYEALRLQVAFRAVPRFDISIETMDAALLPAIRPRKRISIVHHLGFSRDKLYSLLERPLMASLKAANCVVTVSKYWEARLLEMGFRDVRLIYNAFDADYDFEEEELDQFRRRYDLLGKPIVYLGNYGLLKGTRQAAEYLSDLNAHLVVSGDNPTPIPGTHQLRLYHKDYLRLLRVSAVAITMSQFDEGWCRTAHEAMLCGVPVIGSGRGGMHELLEGGGQIVCEQFGQLPRHVKALLGDADHRRALSDSGRKYAAQFSVSRLREDWQDLATQMQS